MESRPVAQRLMVRGVLFYLFIYLFLKDSEAEIGHFIYPFEVLTSGSSTRLYNVSRMISQRWSAFKGTLLVACVTQLTFNAAYPHLNILY